MARFIVHFADGDRLPVEAESPEAARAIGARRRCSIVTKVKLDRTVHRPAGQAGRRSDSRRLFF